MNELESSERKKCRARESHKYIRYVIQTVLALVHVLPSVRRFPFFLPVFFGLIPTKINNRKRSAVQ